jgi:hypothetical protein
MRDTLLGVLAGLLVVTAVKSQEHILAPFTRPEPVKAKTPVTDERTALIKDCEVRRKGFAVELAGVLKSRGIVCVPKMDDGEDDLP